MHSQAWCLSYLMAKLYSKNSKKVSTTPSSLANTTRLKPSRMNNSDETSSSSTILRPRRVRYKSTSTPIHSSSGHLPSWNSLLEVITLDRTNTRTIDHSIRTTTTSEIWMIIQAVSQCWCFKYHDGLSSKARQTSMPFLSFNATFRRKRLIYLYSQHFYRTKTRKRQLKFLKIRTIKLSRSSNATSATMKSLHSSKVIYRSLLHHLILSY